MPWRKETYGRSRNGVQFVKEKTLAYSHKSKVNIESPAMLVRFIGFARNFSRDLPVRQSAVNDRHMFPGVS